MGLEWHSAEETFRRAQVKMFFSSGTAHTNGGGSFCIATYSFVSCEPVEDVQLTDSE